MAHGDGSAAGDVVHTWSPWRYALAMAAISCGAAAVAWFVLPLLISAFAGRIELPPARDGIVFVGLYTFSFTLFSLLFVRRRPPWLAFGDDGIGLATARRDAVLVTRPAVAGARVRRWWPVTVLEVFVAAADKSQVTAAGPRGPSAAAQAHGRSGALCHADCGADVVGGNHPVRGTQPRLHRVTDQRGGSSRCTSPNSCQR